MTVGEMIKNARLDKNLSKQRLADLVYSDVKTIEKYEKDKVREPDYKLLDAIFKALGI